MREELICLRVQVGWLRDAFDRLVDRVEEGAAALERVGRYLARGPRRAAPPDSGVPDHCNAGMVLQQAGSFLANGSFGARAIPIDSQPQWP